jgi:signal transduction histidine kinase
MRLSTLILAHKESILEDFEEYARTHTAPGAAMDIAALRDHAAEILEEFARDLEQPQTDAEQKQKSRGDAPRSKHAVFTAAREHGIDRARSGFSLVEPVAEYRALRASVLRRWTIEKNGSQGSEDQDVIRFNESLDQALVESIEEYSRAVDGYRDMFLAMLGHDLRSPLNAIMNASTVLAEHSELSNRDERLVRTIQRSGERMMDLISDMLDFTASQLGHGIPLRLQAADLGAVVAEAVGEGRATHARREFHLEIGGELTGEWDTHRIRQAISNLLDNAAQHGAPGSAITVTVSNGGAGSELTVTVHNLGPAIPAGEWEQIFDPFRRGSSAPVGDPLGNLGLGLYIARQVAEAHGGGLGVQSAEDQGTTFILRLPRHPPYPEARI